MTIANNCIRCGKARVDVEETRQTAENGTVTKVTKSVCPDPDCQEMVAKMIQDKANERSKKEMMRQNRLAYIREKHADDLMQAPALA